MTAPDFETNLDFALNRLLEEYPREPAHTDAAREGTAEIEELVMVAHRLAVLAPAPEYDLAKGRSEFLGEAERVLVLCVRSPWSWRGMSRRPALLAAMAVIVLFAGVAFTLFMMPGILEPSQRPAVPILATPAMLPTYTATPTRMVQSPTETKPSPIAADGHASMRAPRPEPIPAPVRPSVPAIRSFSELVLYKCLRL